MNWITNGFLLKRTKAHLALQNKKIALLIRRVALYVTSIEVISQLNGLSRAHVFRTCF